MTMASVRRALVVMMIVGPVLTLINQWDRLWTQGPAPLQTSLTFLVPFAVSLVSAWLANRDADT